jgi:cysteine-rich repeat protein
MVEFGFSQSDEVRPARGERRGWRGGSGSERAALRGVAVIALGIGAMLATSVAPSAAQSPDLADYTIVGEREVSINRFGRIRSGGVTVNRADGEPLEIGSFATVDDAGAVVAESVDLRQRASVGDVFANQLTADPSSTVGSVSALSFGPEGRLFDTGSLPSFAPGSASFTLPRGVVGTLPPGSYGSAVVGRNATLVLTGGTYELRKLTLLHGAAVRVQAPVEVRISSAFKTGPQSFIGPEVDSGVGASEIRFEIGARKVLYGTKSRLIGEFHSPRARVRLRDLAALEGRIVGDRVATQPRCSASRCGNGRVNPGEQCDMDDAAQCPGLCLPNCTCGIGLTFAAEPPTCGDGISNPPGEECDDGNTSNDDGCSSTCKLELGQFCTFESAEWGALCAESGAACLRDASFVAAFPEGLEIGDLAGPNGPPGGATALWTTPAHIEAYLPDGGAAGLLGLDSVGAPTTAAGTLASELVTAKLNRAIGGQGAANPRPLGDLALLGCVPRPLQGRTVDELVAFADVAVANGTLPDGVTLSDLATSLATVNENFPGCGESAGCLGVP